MSLLKIISFIIISMVNSTYFIDFGKDKDGKNWTVTNDVVMGGRSDSSVEVLENSIVFKGIISLRNNGGFASLRNQGNKLKLSSYNTVQIRFKTDTRRSFSFRLSASDRFYEPFFKHDFNASTNDWTTVILNLNDFNEFNLNGKTGQKLQPHHMNEDFRMGIILYDKKDGPFEIEIDYIKFNT